MKLSLPAREIVTLCRRHRLTYSTLSKAVHLARRHLSLKPPTSRRQLPKLLTDEQLEAFFSTVDHAHNLQHQLMLRLLLYTAIRVAELCAIKIADVDLAAGRIYILQGKGDKDRYVLFPEAFGLTLRAYVQSVRAENPDQEYLFESSHRRQFSTRRVQQIVTDYAEAAGIEPGLAHPHAFRHQMLTYLTKQGLSDSQIQLISGHTNKKSLETYQHLSLVNVKDDYEKAMRKLEL
jgi:integrase/recombinase XerD